MPDRQASPAAGPRVLVTGGAGYIGSHTVVELVHAGFQPVVLDNFCNSSERVFERLQPLCGQAITWHQGDVRDVALVRRLLEEHRIDAVIHVAGLKAVGESVAKPLLYYDVNVGGLMALLQAMGDTPVRSIVFSSSATVYGDPDRCPIPETAAVRPANPYGHSKAMCERILQDAAAADPSWRAAILRYFNPVGAHLSGTIGEDPRGTPNNLMPFVTQVAAGRRPELAVFGDDYPTVDGTGVRDYIHVVDLALGHVAALRYLAGHDGGATLVNLGTGRPYSVLEMVNTFTQVSGRAVPYRVIERRPGDIATCYADATRAKQLFGWRAERELQAMCADAWRWQAGNPNGY